MTVVVGIPRVILASLRRKETPARDMWRYLELLIPVVLIATAWWRIGVGIRVGQMPLISWMVMAETAVITMLLLTRQSLHEQLRGVPRETLLARTSLPAVDSSSSLIIQFVEIVIGNTIIIGMIVHAILDAGYQWKFGDWANLAIFGFGLGVFLTLTVLRTSVVRLKAKKRVLAGCELAGEQVKTWPWLDALRWNTPWARCWYVVILKVAPQVFQAMAIVLFGGRVDLLGVLALAALGGFRLHYARRGWKASNKSPAPTALFLCALADLLSMLGVLAAALYMTDLRAILGIWLGNSTTLATQ